MSHIELQIRLAAVDLLAAFNGWKWKLSSPLKYMRQSGLREKCRGIVYHDRMITGRKIR